MSNKTRRSRAEMAARAYNMTLDMGQTLRHARKAMGVSPAYIAQCVNVSEMEWFEYERNQKPVPMHIVIKLLMFGMDFWARNRQCFENKATLPATCGGTPPAEGN